MFTVQWPWVALLLPLPGLIWRFWPPATLTTLRTPQLRLPATQRVQQAFSRFLVRGPTRYHRWRWLLLWLSWLGLIAALMSPQWLEKHIEVTQSGYDLMLAVDLSGSMETPDFFTPKGETVDRLTAVKQVLGPFIQRRLGDRIGLILFADQAYLQAPLTLDTEAVNTLLQKAMIGMAGRETAIGDAIGLAVKKLRQRPKSSRVLILLTDGDNNAGILEPLKAAQLAKQYDIRIYTIGVGSQGMMVRYSLNEEVLKKIAQLTDGAYFPATDLKALGRVYAHIDNALQKTEAESRLYFQRTPLYRYPLVISLLALLLLQILRIYTDEPF
ncbi:MAG: VWA domain-containing protein [Pseudomonadota bacterium]|nr:VWA domain-containing protein [Pseudomonadota bacterium]